MRQRQPASWPATNGWRWKRQAWRLHKLDDVPLYAASATQITALVARDQRLMRLALTLPGAGAASDTVRLDVQDAAAAQRWLGAAASPA